MALHPIDVLDASTGRLLSQLVDANLSTICPVNKPHPRVNVIVSGSSRSLYAWRPVSKGMASAWQGCLQCFLMAKSCEPPPMLFCIRQGIVVHAQVAGRKSEG